MTQILFTGFPGFIGTRLVKRLLSDTPTAKLVALVETQMADRARAVAAQIDPNRIEILTGDIGSANLGLGQEDYNRLTSQTTQVYHLAAIYNLAVPETIARQVNVEGTRHIVEFCKASSNLERHHYISTAYVAGTRHGNVFEHELLAGQSFKNHYESTKCEAEEVVRESLADVPTTIYRPAIVTGDSRNGETQKFDGPYFILRVIALHHRLHLPYFSTGAGNAPMNVVPVNFIVDAIATLSNDANAIGETLHLVDPEPMTSHDMSDLMSRTYRGKPPAGHLPPQLFEALLRFSLVRRMLAETPKEAVRYMNHSVRFDTSRAQALLEPHGVRCPHFYEYVGPLVDFFRQHEKDPAFMPAK